MSAEPTAVRHGVKLATVVKSGRAEFFVWECVCGQSSRLHESKSQANDSYRDHQRSKLADVLPADAFSVPSPRDGES